MPPPLRDFHDCKDFFKWMDGISVSHAREDTNSKTHYMDKDLPNWTTGQIYVIDYFLWFMGQFGYTLQRSRANVEFRDLEDEVEGYKKKMQEHFYAIMRAEMNKEKTPQ